MRFKSNGYLDLLTRLKEQVSGIDKLRGKKILITGATGLIGTMLVDLLCKLNRDENFQIRILAVTRSASQAKARFAEPFHKDIEFIELDIASVDGIGLDDVDFAFHLASPTHPLSYSTNPIGVIKANVGGLEALLKGLEQSEGRLIFASSVEIYGENRGDVDRFEESYLGYIDCNSVRAGYNESKRLCEAMCQAWIHQKGVDAVIARLSRVYGPTVLASDSKASTQFIRNALEASDIVLKSAGDQLFSYIYVADAVSGLLAIAFRGETGNAYNLADKRSEITLKCFAEQAANWAGVSLKYELPSDLESKGYSKATRALLDPAKARRNLGWEATVPFSEGLVETLEILNESGWLQSAMTAKANCGQA